MHPSIYNVMVDLDVKDISDDLLIHPKYEMGDAVRAARSGAALYQAAAEDVATGSDAVDELLKPVSIEPRHAVYNTASGDFAVFEGDALPERFLTEKTPDRELAAIVDKFLAYRNDADVFNICIAPTYACNARCPYCYEAEKHTLAPSMSREVQERLVEFVVEHYEAQPFKTLDVQWYGGDPQLALDAVSRISCGFLDFCKARGVEYSALMLTNATLIDDDAARLIAQSGISKAMITVEGTHDLQNTRRPLVDGRDSYEAVKCGIAALQSAGVEVCVTANLDKVSIKRFDELREEFRQEFGLEVGPLKLNDYNASFGCGKFCAPDFDLYTHAEYPFVLHNMQVRDGLDAQTICAILAPTDHFCSGQKNTYLVIDSLGDVYDCDGYLGVPSHKMFSIFDDVQDQIWEVITNDPFTEAKCRECEILPLCLGNCKWERNCCGNPCHPLKHTLPLYIKDLAAAVS